MKITIFGMGYVGVTSAACLLRDGHEVFGVDPSAGKIADLSAGRSPIHEPGVAEMLAEGCRAGRLRAETQPPATMVQQNMIWICVGTPSRPDGDMDLSAVRAVATQIGGLLRGSTSRPLIVLRSTVLPGTTRTLMIPELERASGLRVGTDFHVVFHPEFMREGSAVDDFDHPPRIVVGEHQPGTADTLLALYDRYEAPRFRLSLEEAELVKYCDNLFHAVKITFANEVGALARALGLDARRIADVFCADTKLNISPRYLRPGFAFGGSCLPKDLRAILRHASSKSVSMPMLEQVGRSNAKQIDDLAARVLTHQPRCVGLVGLAFKPDTDDMRESPFVAVAKRLIGEGVTVRICDPGVHPDRLIGGNKQAVQAALRHLESLLVMSPDDMDGCDLVLINHPTVDAARVRAWLTTGVRVIDLVGIDGIDRHTDGYEGIAW